MMEVVRNLSYKVARYFPASTVVEYLLNADSPVLMSIEEYLRLHSSVPFINLYHGNSSFVVELRVKGAEKSLIGRLNKNDYLFQSIYNIKKTSSFYGVHEICVRYR